MSVDKKEEESFIHKYRKEIIGGLITLLAFIFIFLNYQQVEFWFFGYMKMRLIILLVAFYGMGFLTSYLYSYFKKKELRNKVKELEKTRGAEQIKEDQVTIKSLEEKIAKLEKALEKKETPPPPSA